MGLGFHAAAQRKGGQAQQAAMEYNAKISEQQKEEIRRAGELTQYKLNRAKVALHSTQQALYSKSGVLLQGSPMEVMAQSTSDAIMDSMIANYNTKSGMIRAQADADYKRWLGRVYRTTSENEAKATLATGAMDVVTKGVSLLSRFGKTNPTTIPDWQSSGINLLDVSTGAGGGY